MHQGSLLEGEERLFPVCYSILRQSIVPVLLDSVVHRLGEVGLELAGRDGYAVDKEDQVDAVLIV